MNMNRNEIFLKDTTSEMNMNKNEIILKDIQFFTNMYCHYYCIR